MRRALLAAATAWAGLLCAAPATLGQMSLVNPPPGANNFSCRPSPAHPNPVVLVHGLGATMSENWSYISPLLAKRGYCVFALTYGLDPRAPYFGGVIPIEQSAPELGAFVAQVLNATGASKVDLVGHSEGTFMPEYWLKYLGGAPTRNDELVEPYTSGILDAPNVTNHVLQDVCPNDLSEHAAEAFDPVVARLIFNALDPAHAQPVSCAGLPPLAPPPA